MEALNDIKTQRQGTYVHSAAPYKPPMANYYGMLAHNHRAASYMVPSQHLGDMNMNMSNLTNGVAGMNIHHASFGSSKSGSQASGGSSEYSGVSLNPAQALWLPHAQQVVFAASGVNQPHTAMAHSPGMYTHVPTYMQQSGYAAYGQQALDNSPLPNNWASRVSSGEMPALMTPRRDSISSNEQDLPGTPYTGFGMYQNGVAVMDRSPSGVFTHSGTPSPSQLAPYSLPQIPKSQTAPTISPKILALLQKDPPIPRAIPAPSSPLKPLDRSLENKNGETNVYIRGLLPETTDEMLHGWGSRFGDIQSSKSIIDLKTNLCKGFGFIKYHNFEDAENCIRGFHYLGYEVSFARESFYAKLKKFADDDNTNLYISNIPRNMNEHELANLFAPHEVCSTRILRDPSGNGRGVGFARFSSRDVCEEVIKTFNNTPINKNEDEYVIQIRYADTHEQKMLKQQTAAGRQFRAAEYEVGVAAVRGGSIYGQRRAGLGPAGIEAANEFETFMQSQTQTQPPMTGYAYASRFGQHQPARNWMTRSGVPFMQPQRFGQAAIRSVTLPSSTKAMTNGTAAVAEIDVKPNPTTPVKSTANTSATSSNAASDQE